MGIVVPTVDEVFKSFQQALEGLRNGQENATDDEFCRICKQALDSRWVCLGDGVEGNEAGNQIRAIKVQFSFLIENHLDGQRGRIAAAINGIVESIRSRIPTNAGVGFVEFNFEPEGESVDHPSAKKVVCSAKGVIRQSNDPL